MTVGKRIRTLRLNTGLSQHQMAQLLGMTRSGYANIELGRTVPNTDRLHDIAKVFHVDPGTLLGTRKTKTHNHGRCKQASTTATPC